jgi:hypothetical protein
MGNGIQVLGLAGRARMGKDWVASHLCGLWNETGLQGADAPWQCTRLSFADELKIDVGKRLFSSGWFVLETNLPEWTSVKGKYFDWVEENKAILRPVLVSEGMLAREKDPEVWVKKVRSRIMELEASGWQGIVIIPDVRFPNEVKFVNELGGLTLFVNKSDCAYWEGGDSENLTPYDCDGICVNYVGGTPRAILYADKDRKFGQVPEDVMYAEFSCGVHDMIVYREQLVEEGMGWPLIRLAGAERFYENWLDKRAHDK